MKWISIKDNKPPDGATVLVFNDGHITVAWYYKEPDYWNNFDGGLYDVTHWMPLPDPPDDAKEG